MLVLMFLWCLLRDRAGWTARAVIPAEHEVAYGDANDRRIHKPAGS